MAGLKVGKVFAPDKTSSDPRQRTRPVQTATARVTEGDISADTRRACSHAVTISVLTFCNCCSWRSSPSNALITSIDCRPSCRVASRSDCRFRTSLTAAVTALLTHSAKAASSGVTASAMKGWIV